MRKNITYAKNGLRGMGFLFRFTIHRGKPVTMVIEDRHNEVIVLLNTILGGVPVISAMLMNIEREIKC